jgi:hypothetical protein
MFAATILLADTTPAAATAAATVAPATVTAPAAKAERTEKPRLICKSEVVTGSLFPKKTCYTSDDLAQRRQEERANLERMQNNLGQSSH